MTSQMISQIETFFLNIENLIELKLKDNTQNQSEIEEKFNEGKVLIDKLEGISEEQHGLFRHTYHITYASYLKTVGEIDNANIQERLAKKYEEYTKKSERIDNYKTKTMLFAELPSDTNDQDLSRDEISIQEAVNEQLEKIQSILEDKFIESIRENFKILTKNPKIFEGYQEVVNCEANVHKLANGIIDEGLIRLNESQASSPQNSTINLNKKKSEQLVNVLNLLKSLASEAAYLKRKSFILYLLNSPDKIKILFSNVIFTEEGISKRTRELSLHFHPDRAVYPNTPNWLRDEDKYLGVELFRYVMEFKDKLLADLENISKNEGYLIFHEQKANELWKTSIDYRNAAKSEWDKLKLVKKNDIEELNPEELKNLSVATGKLAYQEYRAACQIADKTKQLQKQVKLRGYMALCLYISNEALESQLYALSAIYLQLQNSDKVAQYELAEAKKIFDKVKGGNFNERNNSNNTLTVIKTEDQNIPYTEKKKAQNLISTDIAKICTELMLKADRSLVRYKASEEEILKAKNHAFKHKLAGTITLGATGFTICEAVVVIGIGTALINPVLLLLTGIALHSGIAMVKKGADLLKEPEIREKLNKIMDTALKAYDGGEYQKFFDELSKEYEKGVSLIKLEKQDDVINPKDIIKTLISHGFRSDGIAYLLNLIGEALSSGNICVEGRTKKELMALAKTVFKGVLNEKLIKEAKNLDDRIHELRKIHRKVYISYVKSTFDRISDFILFKEYTDLAKEHQNDAQEMPFQARLEEMSNIARINLAIIDILDAGLEEISRATKTIKEVQNSIKCNYQFVGMAKSRLEVLEDLLWVIGGCKLPEELPENELELITYSTEETPDVNDEYFRYLTEKLQHASSDKEKLNLYTQFAVHYEKMAEKDDKLDKLSSLFHWQSAQNNYREALAIDSHNQDLHLSYAKCLLKLSKYTQVIDLSNENTALNSLSEYWCFLSIAHCKKAYYERANVCINEALSLDSKNILAGNQKKLLKKFMQENKIKNLIDHYVNEKKAIKYEVKNSYSNESPAYNILSIDGGGIRGILPALWLSEIECRTHKPISYLFNMIAGTSTGGIIATGLSAPWFDTYDEEMFISNDPAMGVSRLLYDYSRPRFLASDLLNIYKNEAESLFSKKWKWDIFNMQIIKEKYTNHGRSALFNEKFKETRLDKVLTELVIPAANETNLTKTHLFTRYNALKNPTENVTLVDALMATTAAPTFFPPHKINNKGVFLDGGIHLNNPAFEAYSEAINYKVDNKKISVLSLGTGSYIPDPFSPEKYRGQLFWAQNLHNTIMHAQEGNTDRQMYTMLGNRYQRWQLWFENPIRLDDLNSIPYLLEMGYQYIEELDYSDENPINKLVELLLLK
ncbi:24071_t:CDS:1 [Dentiscutata erythropus]|uniref:24071_t:CDS:1 n=1 Tax=Dentiscutata erythropus TaxID=1348616 RepID=A0A9N8YNZ0_9GLOM|nr:24071_t:CDS:1 [Dentiscutata erythropus]